MRFFYGLRPLVRPSILFFGGAFMLVVLLFASAVLTHGDKGQTVAGEGRNADCASQKSSVVVNLNCVSISEKSGKSVFQ